MFMVPNLKWSKTKQCSGLTSARTRTLGVVLTVLLSCPTAAAAHGASLFGGSLTWSIHPKFATGKRLVEFTLDTSFEMDLTNSNCVYTI